MKATGFIGTLVLLALVVTDARSANDVNTSVEIDWSKVRPIEEFDHYWARLPPELQALRRTRLVNRPVTNGFAAFPGQFPYQVVLLPEFLVGTGLCGAVVLTNVYILTAAHCVVQGVGVIATGGTAIMGAYDRSIPEPDQQRIRFSGSGITVHPQYTALTLRNDIATVLLNAPMSYTVRVQPIRLPTLSDTRTFTGMLGTVSGFGRTSDSSLLPSNFVRYASNPIISNSECLTYWTPIYLGAENICMSGASARSPCSGDSGGPLTVNSALGPLQVGLISFGDTAGCTSGIPSVHARITYFLQWILDNSDY
ncbi:AGAP005670-PA-like protein [Anopheles sinensis]|uniref:AGAP005670-PA-like protein n=1 Tax=Anopheles sinensis TaxID=74873 RepID=A0A084WA68_ANOSI|nr:AGAP005670-PA-like protein [Anopheles sinensis]